MKARVLPVSQQQNHCLVMLHQPDTTEECQRSWIMQRTIRVRPGIDVDRMRRAVAQVVQRHDSLRIRFVEKKMGWSAVLEPEGHGFFEARDLGTVSPDELAAHIKASSAPPADLSKDPLFRVTVFRCGTSGDVVHAYLHHLLVDGWSYMLVLGEVFQAYVGAPLAPLMGATLEDYLLRFGGTSTPEATAARTELARSVLLPVLTAPKIGRAAKGIPSNLSRGDVHASGGFSSLLASSAVEKVRANARSAAVSETVMMAAAFGRAISLASDQSDLYIVLTVSGRSDARLERLVGWLACGSVIRCEGARGDLAEVARRISSQLRQIQENAPLENVLFYSDMAREVKKQGGFMRQFFCNMYLPEGVAKATPLSGLVMGPPDGKLSFGGIEVAMMPNPNDAAETKFELSLQSLIRGDSYAYRTSYDITAFEREEAAAITLVTLKSMGCNESEVRIE